MYSYYQDYIFFKMTVWSNFFKLIYQTFFIDKDIFNSFKIKAEVLTDSKLIVNSIRILIITSALLLAYNHSSDKKNEGSDTNKNELIDNSLKPIME